MNRTQIAALIVPTQQSLHSKAAHSDPLAPIAGKSISGWIVDAALAASVRRIGIIAGNPLAATRSELARRSDDALIEFVTSTNDVTETLRYAVERLGSELTLHDAAHILILPAESPQLQATELRSLVDRHVASGVAATLLASPQEETGHGEPVMIRDAAGTLLSISEVSAHAPSILCIRASLLIPALHRAASSGWHAGAPLAEIVAVLTEVGHEVDVVERAEPIASIRSGATRAPIEMALRDRIVTSWIERDIVMTDPRQVSIDATVTIGKGVQVLPGTILEGSTVIGDGAVVGPNTHIVDSVIGSQAVVPHAVVQGVEVPVRGQVEPFSVLGSVSS